MEKDDLFGLDADDLSDILQRQTIADKKESMILFITFDLYKPKVIIFSNKQIYFQLL